MGTQKTSPLTEAVYYILLSLYTPLHGYGILQNVKTLTGGRLTLGAGTLYGAINTLLDKGWILEHPTSTPAKRTYQITDAGKRVVLDETVRLKELIRNGEAILAQQQ